MMLYIGNDQMIEAPSPGLDVRTIAGYSSGRMSKVARPLG